MLHVPAKYHVCMHRCITVVACHSYHQQQQHLLSSIYTQVLSSARNSGGTVCYQLIDKCTRQPTVSPWQLQALLFSLSPCSLSCSVQYKYLNNLSCSISFSFFDIWIPFDHEVMDAVLLPIYLFSLKYSLHPKINAILELSTQTNAMCKIIKISLAFCKELMRC